MKEPATIPIHEAKSTLSKLIKRAAAGETIYIGAYGKPEAVLTAVSRDEQRAELRKKAFGCIFHPEMRIVSAWDCA